MKTMHDITKDCVSVFELAIQYLLHMYRYKWDEDFRYYLEMEAPFTQEPSLSITRDLIFFIEDTGADSKLASAIYEEINEKCGVKGVRPNAESQEKLMELYQSYFNGASFSIINHSGKPTFILSLTAHIIERAIVPVDVFLYFAEQLSANHQFDKKYRHLIPSRFMNFGMKEIAIADTIPESLRLEVMEKYFKTYEMDLIGETHVPIREFSQFVESYQMDHQALWESEEMPEDTIYPSVRNQIGYD